MKTIAGEIKCGAPVRIVWHSVFLFSYSASKVSPTFFWSLQRTHPFIYTLFIWGQKMDPLFHSLTLPPPLHHSLAPSAPFLVPPRALSSGSPHSVGEECLEAPFIFCLHNAFLKTLYLRQSFFWSESGYPTLFPVSERSHLWGSSQGSGISWESLPSINMTKLFLHMVNYLCKAILTSAWFLDIWVGYFRQMALPAPGGSFHPPTAAIHSAFLFCGWEVGVTLGCSGE